MSLTIDKLMAQGVVVANLEHTADYVLRQILTLDIHAVPVADGDGRPVGIVGARELLRSKDPEAPVAEIMDREAATIERGATVQTAASLMRQNRQRRLVVTEGDTIVGLISAFDLLELVERGTFGSSDAPAKETASEFRTGIIDMTKIREGL